MPGLKILPLDPEKSKRVVNTVLGVALFRPATPKRAKRKRKRVAYL